ncbi:hypothetical protein [Microbacterium sp. G2-8]|uniref:DUF7544 domain-containing protein n=1 Tax=Microbacterium sp. G2-8 TaxID=2842454 RepID=UPI001C88FDE9|nr:hypothetical protein [Microbacterium sp. G2-8]
MTDHSSASWAPAPRQGLVPLYPFGFGTILGKAFAVLKGNPKVLLLFVVGLQTLAMVLLFLGVGGVAAWTFSRAETVPEFSEEFAQIMAGSTAILIIATILLSLLLTCVTTIAQGVVVAEVGHASLGEKARLSVLWRRVGPAFWRLFGYAMLLGVATFIGMIILILPAALILGLTGAFSGSGAGSVWIGVIVLLLALLGGLVLYAWLGTKLYLVPAAIVLEGVGPLRGVRRSWTLTRGRFWGTFGILVLLYLITNTAASVVSGVFSLFTPLIMTIFVPLGASSTESTPMVVLSVVLVALTSIVSFAIAAILMIVLSAGGALCYIDARMRDEGIDLRMRRYVDAGGAAADPYEFIAGAQPSPHAHPSPAQAWQTPPAAPAYPPAAYGGPAAPAPPTSAPAPAGPSATPTVPSNYPAPQRPRPGSPDQPPAPPV